MSVAGSTTNASATDVASMARLNSTVIARLVGMPTPTLAGSARTAPSVGASAPAWVTDWRDANRTVVRKTAATRMRMRGRYLVISSVSEPAAFAHGNLDPVDRNSQIPLRI